MKQRIKRHARGVATALLIGTLIGAGVALAAPTKLYVYDRNGNLVRVTDTQIDPQNCGAANVVCPTANLVPPLCRSGACTDECVTGYRNCDTSAANGCETALNTVNNCGACGIKCSTNHITAACGSPAGPCNGACNSGYADCNANKQTDGCEVNVMASATNCGTCGAACSTNNIAAACSGGQCTGTCAAWFGDCDANKRTNGCEASLTTVSNCGTCGRVCGSPGYNQAPGCASYTVMTGPYTGNTAYGCKKCTYNAYAGMVSCGYS